ncbi:MAG: hypothetical protein CME64_01515 [Halobacteriovoraceae bacterium]|nr:hypothetical protein [Halobacteriovoraceae bacterium]|tara:strand:+ start:20178 stop:20366 length:189 start_codon:yes stop_codon:yes gene_type:complete
MSAAKKFRDNYPKEKSKDDTQNQRDKAAILAYKDKIEDLLCKDPKMQKKAADIISKLINSNK